MVWQDVLKGNKAELLDAINEHEEFIEYLEELKEKGQLPMNINQLGEHYEEVAEVVERINELSEYIVKLFNELKARENR